MLDIVHITPEFAIGPQLSVEDFVQLRSAGFASVLNARPDDEVGEYLLSDAAARIAADLGLGYAHSPTEGHEIFETEIIDRFENALIELPKPIFSHCKTGTRSAMLWALVAARHRDVDEVIATLHAAGQEFDFLEDELRDAASEARGSILRMKDDALMGLGRSSLLGGERENPDC